MQRFSFGTMEKKEWLGFDSFETEETETKKMSLRCKTLNEILDLYRHNPSMVNISKTSTLLPTIGIDNTVISEFDLVGRKIKTTKENTVHGHTQNTNHQYVTK